MNSETCAWIYDPEIDGWQTECGETYLRQDDAILPMIPKDRTICGFCGQLITDNVGG